MQHSTRDNEELAEEIQRGQAELLQELWHNVEAYTQARANRFHELTAHIIGIDTDDLMQEAFFALSGAVKAFDAESGYKFLTYYEKHLKTAFANCCGLRTQRDKLDPIQNHRSLDEQIENAQGDTRTIADTIPDKRAEQAFEAIEATFWNDELHEALKSTMELLPTEEAELLQERYFDGRARKDIADSKGIKYDAVKQKEKTALQRMKRKASSTSLRSFWVENSAYNYTSLGHYINTGCSSQETLIQQKEAWEKHR